MISVCIATYNGEKYIRLQLDSILKQLSLADEVIISDDGSKDATLDLVRSYNDSRIKIFNHEKKILKKSKVSSFMYATNNFENAISKASGDIIFLADQDDVWADNRVQIMKEALETNDFVLCNLSLINGEGKVIREKLYDENPVGKTFFSNLYLMPFRGCTMAFRKEALDLAMPFPNNCVCHDNWIGLCLSYKKKKFKYIDTPLHLYRTHSNNVSPVLEKSPNSLSFKIAYRLRFLRQIMTRFR